MCDIPGHRPHRVVGASGDERPWNGTFFLSMGKKKKLARRAARKRKPRSACVWGFTGARGALRGSRPPAIGDQLLERGPWCLAAARLAAQGRRLPALCPCAHWTSIRLLPVPPSPPFSRHFCPWPIWSLDLGLPNPARRCRGHHNNYTSTTYTTRSFGVSNPSYTVNFRLLSSSDLFQSSAPAGLRSGDRLQRCTGPWLFPAPVRRFRSRAGPRANKRNRPPGARAPDVDNFLAIAQGPCRAKTPALAWGRLSPKVRRRLSKQASRIFSLRRRPFRPRHP